MANMSRGLAASLVCAVSLARAGGTPTQPATPAQMRIGRAIYQQYCAACHGARGEGAPHWQHPDALGEMPPPPHNSAGHTWKHADGMLYQLVHDGWRDPFNKTSRLTMPAFRQTLTPVEIRSVIDYIKTMWTPAQRRFQQRESRHAPFPQQAR